MKLIHFVYLSIAILILALCYVFIWKEEPRYLPNDTRLVLDREYLLSQSPGKDYSVEISDSAKYILYFKILENELNGAFSTHNQYVVIRATNILTEEEREICLTGFALFSALKEESGLGRTEINELLLKNKERSFCFKNQDVLNRIGFYKDKYGISTYSADELRQYRKMINIDQVKTAIFTNPFLNPILRNTYSSDQIDSIKTADWELIYQNSQVGLEESRMLAHIMFNHGIPMGYSSCAYSGAKFDLPEEEIWVDWIKQESHYQRE